LRGGTLATWGENFSPREKGVTEPVREESPRGRFQRLVKGGFQNKLRRRHFISLKKKERGKEGEMQSCG